MPLFTQPLCWLSHSSFIHRAQEELEEKLEKYATRRLPLGYDRHQRRYWWGLAGHRPVVWVEDAEVGALLLRHHVAQNSNCAVFRLEGPGRPQPHGMDGS